MPISTSPDAACATHHAGRAKQPMVELAELEAMLTRREADSVQQRGRQEGGVEVQRHTVDHQHPWKCEAAAPVSHAGERAAEATRRRAPTRPPRIGRVAKVSAGIAIHADKDHRGEGEDLGAVDVKACRSAAQWWGRKGAGRRQEPRRERGNVRRASGFAADP